MIDFRSKIFTKISSFASTLIFPPSLLLWKFFKKNFAASLSSFFDAMKKHRSPGKFLRKFYARIFIRRFGRTNFSLKRINIFARVLRTSLRPFFCFPCLSILSARRFSARIEWANPSSWRHRLNRFHRFSGRILWSTSLLKFSAIVPIAESLCQWFASKDNLYSCRKTIPIFRHALDFFKIFGRVFRRASSNTNAIGNKLTGTITALMFSTANFFFSQHSPHVGEYWGKNLRENNKPSDGTCEFVVLFFYYSFCVTLSLRCVSRQKKFYFFFFTRAHDKVVDTKSSKSSPEDFSKTRVLSSRKNPVGFSRCEKSGFFCQHSGFFALQATLPSFGCGRAAPGLEICRVVSRSAGFSTNSSPDFRAPEFPANLNRRSTTTPDRSFLAFSPYSSPRKSCLFLPPRKTEFFLKRVARNLRFLSSMRV